MVRLDGLVKLLWIIILTGACQSEDRYDLQQDGPILVKLSVSASDTGTSSVSNAGPDGITSVYVLQFNADGDTYGTLRHVAEGRSNGPGETYTANLLQSVNNNDNYKLVILANLSSYSFLYGLCGKSYQDVQQACLSASTTEPLVFDGIHPFPMFGVVNGGASVQVNQNSVYTGVTKLVRAVARVDIGIGTPTTDADGIVTSWARNNATPFVMTDIQVWKAGRSYTYMPATANFHWNSVGSGTSYEIVIDNPTEARAGITTKSYGTESITNGTYSIGRIYLPEALLAWGNVYDASHTRRLAIIVGGHYKNSPDMSYYRVDFTNEKVSPPNDKMDILRNHLYQFTISSVNAAGYTSADLAYKSKPKNLGFNATIEPWGTGTTTSVSSFLGYNLTYKGFNGEKVDWTYAAGSSLPIPEKGSTWPGFKYTFDYNNFYKEGNNLFGPDIMGGQNGCLYATVPDAFSYEGTFPNLMVSANDVVDEAGNESPPWKTGTTLTAFDLCRNLEEYGYDDWRLPRLSELALIYLNEGSLDKLRGFTPLSGTYWCGSEYLIPNPSEMDQYKSGWAWAVDFTTGYASGHLKTDKLKIRCVRQRANNE